MVERERERGESTGGFIGCQDAFARGDDPLCDLLELLLLLRGQGGELVSHLG